MSKKPYSELKNLGKNNKTINTPNHSILEKVKNPHSEIYNIRFSVPEFTSICPVTGQPDFAFFLIDYVPNNYCCTCFFCFQISIRSRRNRMY